MNEKGERSSGEVAHVPGKRHRYEKPLAHYAPLLNRSVRSLKSLVAIGKDAVPPDLPPFDDLPAMKGWWLRRMKNRVPDDIAALATVAAPTPPSPPTAPPPAIGPLFDAVPPGSSASAPAIPGSVPGFLAALKRVRDAEAATGRLYNLLLAQAAAPDCLTENRSRFAAEAESARRAWDDNLNRLRTMERDAAPILAASGRMWNADDVLAANDLVHQVLRESIRGLLRRARPKLLGRTPAEQDDVWAAEVEGLFSELRENKFTAPPAAPSSDDAAA